MKIGKSMTKKLWMVLLTSLVTACASGSYILTGQQRQPIQPTGVKLYTSPPSNYEVIAIVNASSDAGWTEQGSQDYAVEELKNQAAKLGANGVLLITTGEISSAAIGSYGNGKFFAIPVTAKTISGKAIYIQ